MRTITTFILMAFMIGCASSQEIGKDFNAFYHHYENDEGVTTFEIPLSLARHIIQEEATNNDDMVKKINKMRFFISEHDNGQYIKKIDNYLPENVYHDLMIIKDDGATVTFKVKEPLNGKIKEIIMTIKDPDSFVAISFTGNFTYDDARKMSNSIKSDKMLNFKM